MNMVAFVVLPSRRAEGRRVLLPPVNPGKGEKVRVRVRVRVNVRVRVRVRVRVEG